MLRIVEVVFGGPRTGDKRARRRLARCVDSGTSSSSSVKTLQQGCIARVAQGKDGRAGPRQTAADRTRSRRGVLSVAWGVGGFGCGVWCGHDGMESRPMNGQRGKRGN